ncbi:MAG: hypothetical protein IJ757_06555 [Clostridiales bacterium]|nr:hypothetical protein [Clostridiales bacterium]
MSPLDLSVLLFFILVSVKALVDSFDFWRKQDEAAMVELRLDQIRTSREVNRANRRPSDVTRTSVRTSSPYRVYRVDMRPSVIKPVPRKILQERRGTGDGMRSAA